MFADAYRGRRVLVTGHTGFKGSWLSLWLSSLGAEVHGIALAPNTEPNHWDLLKLPMASNVLDIRDADALRASIQRIAPEMVFHLAAQPLVRLSYAEPIGTWATNVMGTVHVLDACRELASLKGVVVVTSDKCYENRETTTPYSETDRLGGHDPYSASKAATELAVASYRAAFFHAASAPLIASARAGNVIGGGDWSTDRLIPDAERAVHRGEALNIRHPNATRPWQHVLESLSGYLLLGQRLLAGDRAAAQAWNFGPEPSDHARVGDVLTQLQRFWPALKWDVTENNQLHEAGLLALDSSKVRQALGWQPVWRLADAVRMTAEWHQAYRDHGSVLSAQQLQAYVASAQSHGVAWSRA